MKDEKKTKKTGKLLVQIMKFGVVGGISFLIDFVVYTIVIKVLGSWEYAYLPAGFAGFTISLIFNYLASMAFVFQRKDDADRKKEFAIFLVLSLFGLLLNMFVLWLCMNVIYYNVAPLQNLFADLVTLLKSIGIHAIASAQEFASYVAKVIATAIVMVYNFVSRKMTLEKKEDE